MIKDQINVDFIIEKQEKPSQINNSNFVSNKIEQTVRNIYVPKKGPLYNISFCIQEKNKVSDYIQ